jgi:ribonuclease HI/dsDNA-binding SOS-regulon protein
MASPKTTKDVQRLTGSLAALSRFLSRGAEKQLPFFNILRKAKKFEWTMECETAFQQLKKHLEHLPTLMKPERGEELFLYIAASTEAVSAVLVKEINGRQHPVYFVSRALQGPETRYTGLEQLVLALVHASRRLKPYFQAHPIVVLTNYPLKQVMMKPEASGRLMKWAIELGEHEIKFQPRKAIKGQALADFLNESTVAMDTGDLPKQEGEPKWKLHVDGSSHSGGSGAGILLTCPEGKEYPYALQFGFKTTNNEAEYEALIAGLRLARELGVRVLEAFSDSQIVVQQVNGEYEARDRSLQRYLEMVKPLIAGFNGFELTQVPREENSKADALSKLASSELKPKPGQKLLMETLRKKSYEEEQVASVELMAPDDSWITPIKAYLAAVF